MTQSGHSEQRRETLFPEFTNRSRFPVCSDAQAVLACFRTYWPDLFFTVAGLENGTRLPIVATHKLGYWAFRFRSLGTVSDCGLPVPPLDCDA